MRDSTPLRTHSKPTWRALVKLANGLKSVAIKNCSVLYNESFLMKADEGSHLSRDAGKLPSIHKTLVGTMTGGEKNYGGAGYRSRYLSHAKRALYHLSYAPFVNKSIYETISRDKLRTTCRTGSYYFLRSTESIRAHNIPVIYHNPTWGA